MRIALREIHTPDTAANRYKIFSRDHITELAVDWPLTFVEVTMSAGGTGVRFGPTITRLPRGHTLRGAVMSRNPVGINFG